MTKKRTVAVVALVVLTAAAIFAFSACSSGEGAWAEMGVDKDSITGITLVSGSGTLKRLEGDRLTAFIADFDALTLRKSSEGFPDNGYDYAVRVTSAMICHWSFTRWVKPTVALAGRVMVARPLLSMKVPGAAVARKAAAFCGMVKSALPSVILCSTFER